MYIKSKIRIIALLIFLSPLMACEDIDRTSHKSNYIIDDPIPVLNPVVPIEINDNNYTLTATLELTQKTLEVNSTNYNLSNINIGM